MRLYVIKYSAVIWQAVAYLVGDLLVFQSPADTLLAMMETILMRDGISCRIGILSGRLRAYEREEDLVSLIESA